jgi:hypothetical protein
MPHTDSQFVTSSFVNHHNSIYCIHVNTTLFSAGGVSCLGRHVSAGVPSSGPVLDNNYSTVYLTQIFNVNRVDTEYNIPVDSLGVYGKFMLST